MSNKGQSSIEFLAILAFSLAVFTGVVFAVNSQVLGVSESLDSGLAEKALGSLEASATDAFVQGEGLGNFTVLNVPSGIEGSNSGVDESSIKYFIGGTMHFRSLEFPVDGKIPLASGYNVVRVFSKNGKVTFRPSCILPDIVSFSKKVPAASSARDFLKLKNFSGTQVSVSMEQQKSSEDIELQVSEHEFTLSPGESKSVELFFASLPSASGKNFGKMTVTISSEECVDSFEIPVTIDSSGSGILSVFPARLSGTYAAGSENFADLSLCNNSETAVHNVSVQASGGIAEWFGEQPEIGSILPGCIDVSAKFIVPSEASGESTGFFTFTDGYNSASARLDFTAGGG